jgi:hypothetical protein
MYISNMQHFLDATTKKIPFTLTQTEIRCFEKGCKGLIKSEVLKANNEIHWVCSKCQNEGVISEWQKTKWNNTKINK